MREEEQKIKETLKHSVISPSENFKERVMHQIKAEEALQPKANANQSTLADYFTILGIGYCVVLILAIYSFKTNGFESFENKYIQLVLITVLALTSLLGLLLLRKRMNPKHDA